MQELLGHKSVETTMIYTHVLNKGGKGVRSPLDKTALAAWTPPKLEERLPDYRIIASRAVVQRKRPDGA